MITDRALTLTPTSYIVLGLLELYGNGTPYDLKAWAARSIGNFWSVPHSALYAEPERLAGAGYLTEQQEQQGRRRKLYSLTARGRQALEAWRAAPTEGMPELRDPGLLKLFFGADARPLALARREAHRRKLTEYQARQDHSDRAEPPGAKLTLDAGLGHEREWVRFWSRLADG